MWFAYYKLSCWSSLTSVLATSSTSRSDFIFKCAYKLLLRIFLLRNLTISFFSMLNISAKV